MPITLMGIFIYKIGDRKMASVDNEINQLVTFSNNTNRQVELVLEPWGECTTMEPKTERKVLVGGLSGKGNLRVDVTEAEIMVSAWGDITLLIAWDD
jgi:hypothetical protein